MTEGEEVYQDKGDSLIHIVKYALDLFRLSLLAVGSVSLSKRLQKKKDGLLLRRRRTNIFRQFLTVSTTLGAYVKDNIHGC